MRFSRRGRLSILLLCDNHRSHANTVLDHISAFTDFSEYDVRLYNPRWVIGSASLDPNEFDVVVIHYSIYILSDQYLSENFREKLRRFRGLKVQFIQDDYRRIDEIASAMRDLGIHVLFTLYPTEQIPQVWGEHKLPGVVKLSTLAGYVPERLVGVRVPPIESRSLDIGYRGRMVPYWLGRFGQEKMWIGQGVLERSEQYGVTCDIAWCEEDRIYGEDWNRFLSSCKATLGTESGASITDFDGSVERKVKEYLTTHPAVSFEKVQEEVLQPYEDNVPIKVISPRLFEAIALRTALILFPGTYSGILKPWVHYIPLERDFSNLAEVAEKMRDSHFLRTLTDRAYSDIVTSGRYSFRSFIKEFDEIVVKYAKPYGHKLKMRYTLARIERVLCLSFARVFGELIQTRRREIVLTGPRTETFAALKLVWQTPPLRRVFLRYLKDVRRWKDISLKTLMKELFLLAIIEKAQVGALDVLEPFSLSFHFSPNEGHLMITSRRLGQDAPASAIQAGEPESDSLPSWPSIYSLLLDGRINAMVWNHSGISGHMIYRVKSFLWLSICVGDNGVRNFSSVVSLTTPRQ